MKIPILQFCMLIGAVLGSTIVQNPTDTTGTMGGVAKFVCEVDYGEDIPTMTWLFNNVIIYFYMDYQVDYPLRTNKYVVSDSHTIFTLEVRNLNFADGGNYICKVIGQEKSAALIVLGPPVITQQPTNLTEGTIATFICEAEFGGPSIDKIGSDDHPQMKLFLDDVMYEAKSIDKKEFAIHQIYEILVDGSMDTKDLECEIGTTNSNQTSTSSTIVNVLYSVRNITYSPLKEKYEFGSIVMCSARGNPTPLYQWSGIKKMMFWKQKEIVKKGQLLHITKDMEGKPSWTCTARNSYGGRMYEDNITAEFLVVPIIPKGVTDRINVIFLKGVGCLGAGILGLLLAYRGCRAVRYKLKKSNVTASFYVATSATVLGSSLSHGWNMGVLNIPQIFIKNFINESFTEHYGFNPSSDHLEMLWAMCVSIYLISGCFGMLIAGKLADKLGRKRALCYCYCLETSAAYLLLFCTMAHSFELLIVGRLIIGVCCGARRRLVLMYLSDMAPEYIKNEVLMLDCFGISFGILLSQIAGLRHCLGNESWWPSAVSLTAYPTTVSMIILRWFPSDFSMKHNIAQKEEDTHLKKVTERELFQPEWRALSPCLIRLCVLNIFQQLSGIYVVLYYSQSIFEASGIPQGIIEYCVLLTGSINVLTTQFTIMGDFKHKHVLIIGMIIMILSSLLMTLAFHLQNFYISIISINTFVLGFAQGFGSVTSYIGRDLFFAGPRTPAITIAYACNYFGDFLVALGYPILYLKAGPYSFLPFTGILVISTIWLFVKLPETKDKTLKEVYKKLEINIDESWPIEDKTTLSETEYKKMVEIYKNIGNYWPTDDTTKVLKTENKIMVEIYNKLGIAIKKYETEQEEETMQPEEGLVLEINEHHQPEDDTNQLEENPLLKNNEPHQPEEDTNQLKENPLLKNNEPHQPEEEMIQPEENPLLKNNEPHQPEEETIQLEKMPMLRNNEHQENSDTNTTEV